MGSVNKDRFSNIVANLHPARELTDDERAQVGDAPPKWQRRHALVGFLLEAQDLLNRQGYGAWVEGSEWPYKGPPPRIWVLMPAGSVVRKIGLVFEPAESGRAAAAFPWVNNLVGGNPCGVESMEDEDDVFGCLCWWAEMNGGL